MLPNKIKFINSSYNEENRKKNLCVLRQYLKMNQKEFIEYFLIDDNGIRIMSESSFSNAENKGGRLLEKVIDLVSETLCISSVDFSLDTEAFIGKIKNKCQELGEESIFKSRKLDFQCTYDLVILLTKYFADKILNGELSKGDKIDSDRDLAKKMNVARSAIREALKVLQVFGMIEIIPGQGMYISGKESDFFVIPLAWSLFLNSTQIEYILDVRNMLEKKSAQLAANCKDKVKIEKLDSVMNKMEEVYKNGDFQEFLDLDIQFHILIAECAGNPIISTQIQTIRNIIKHISKTGMNELLEIQTIYEEHKQIYNAIKSNNSDIAGAKMEKHTENSMSRYRL